MAYLESTSGANLSVAQSVTGTAASTNVFDVTGAGAGNAPAMIGAGGVNTALGYDIGGGEGVATPQVLISISAVTTVTGTLTVALQAAPDNGSYSPGTYVTIFQSAALTGATQLFVGQLYVFPIPPIPKGLFTGDALARFYRLNYTVGSSISLVLSASILINGALPYENQLYGNNFPAGL